MPKGNGKKIRTSLEFCGDIGPFDKEDFMVGIIEEDVIVRQPLSSPTKSVSGYSPTFYPMYFLKNVLLMDEKFEDMGYNTLEAMYVFLELATKAVSRLGFTGNLAMGFWIGLCIRQNRLDSRKGINRGKGISFTAISIKEGQLIITGNFSGIPLRKEWKQYLISLVNGRKILKLTTKKQSPLPK